MIRIPEYYAYLVTKTTLEHDEGNLENLSVHATAEHANAAVNSYLAEWD